MKPKISAFEIRRKLFHIFGLLFVILGIYYEFLNFKIFIIIFIIGVIASSISKYHNIPVIAWFLDKFDRSRDKKKMPGKGALVTIAGVILVTIIFPKDVALAGLTILMLGDSVSALLTPFGRIRHPWSNFKVLEGTLAGFILAFIGAQFFVGLSEAFFAAFFAMLFETIEIKAGEEILDDNITIPIIAGVVILLMRYFF